MSLRLNKVNLFFITYLIGFLIGFFSISQFSHKKIVSTNLAKVKNVSSIDMLQNETINTAETSIVEVKKLRILCFLNTRPLNHKSRAVHIKATWAKHCDKLLFASTLTDVNLGAIGFNVSDNHDTMWGKVKLMLQYIHKNHIDEYDWFMKGDDDMFMIPENLRFLLAAYSTDDPIYFGYKFNTTEHKWGYFQGGSGYVMSRQAVRIFVEKALTNREFFQKDHKNGSSCHIETDYEHEDWHITFCFDYYNVYAGDGRDLVKRDRFLPFRPVSHLLGHPIPGNWYWIGKYYFNDEGLDCCSNYTISFHYVKPWDQYTMYYLVYRLQAFGITHRFPPPPMKKNFSEVARALDAERFNLTLRGY